MFRIGIRLLIGMCLAPALIAQSVDPQTPDEVMPYTVTDHAPGAVDYLLMSPFRIFAFSPSPAQAPKSQILGPEGNLIWYSDPFQALNVSDFKYHPSEKVYTQIHYKAGGLVEYQLLDTAFNLIRSLQVVGNAEPDSHEFDILSNGNYVVSARQDSIFDLSAYTFNGNPGSAATTVRCFIVQELDSANNLLWQWNSCDHLHPSEAYDEYGFNGSGTFDYCHGNSIEEDAGGDYWVSFRHLNAVVKISRQDGSVLQRLGGKMSHYVFPNDSGFSGQHDARILPDGSMSLFDNGNMANPQRSRAVVYTLDSIAGIAVRSASWTPAPPVFGEGMGGFQYSEDRQILSYGQVFRPDPSVQVWNSAGTLLREVFLLDSAQTYRTHAYPELPLPPLPEIQCTDSAGLVYLTAPSGHDRYEWSTGQDTQGIWALPNDTYRVWVRQGTGMLSSLPVSLGSTGCPLVSAGSPEPEKPVRVGITDLLGRPLAAPLPGQVCLWYYSDGSVRKVFLTN